MKRTLCTQSQPIRIALVLCLALISANLTLTTNETDPLAQLLGGSSTAFPIIQQFNTFAAANMQVGVND